MGYPVCPNRIHSSGINGPWKSLFETTKSFLGDGHRLKLFLGVWESGEGWHCRGCCPRCCWPWGCWPRWFWRQRSRVLNNFCHRLGGAPPTCGTTAQRMKIVIVFVRTRIFLRLRIKFVFIPGLALALQLFELMVQLPRIRTETLMESQIYKINMICWLIKTKTKSPSKAE